MTGTYRDGLALRAHSLPDDPWRHAGGVRRPPVEGDWEADGWVVAREVLDEASVGRLRDHLDLLLAGRPKEAATGLLAGTVVDDPVWLGAVADPRLLDVVSSLLGPGMSCCGPGTSRPTTPPSSTAPAPTGPTAPAGPSSPATTP